ncbi:hypothetical protein WDU94_000601 [Cyamophila willieti]
MLEEFIELYKNEPCLWKVSSKDYHNKIKRAEAFNKLVLKLKEIDPAADKEAALKKINNLRTTFRKEYKKVIKSMKSGAGRDEIYVPKLGYYNLLLFIRDEETPRPSTSNLESSEVEDEESIMVGTYHLVLNSIILPCHFSFINKIISKPFSDFFSLVSCVSWVTSI